MPSSRYIIGNLPYYSVLIVTGMILAIMLASREEKRLGFPKDTVVDLALVLIPVSVVCARIYYVAFAWDAFREHPLSIFAIWEGGIAIYGGLIGGVLTVLLFAHFRHLNALLLMDMLVPGVALAQAIGRWGNFFNMEAYGLRVDHPAFQFFPFAVQIPEGGILVWHMATFFYESCWNLIIFLILYLLRKRSRQPGQLFLLYSLLYGAGRLVIEGLRTDSLMAGSLRISQVLGFTVCIAVLFWMFLRSSPHRPHLLFFLLLLCQPLIFWFLPATSSELSYAPFFFLILSCLFPCVQLSAVHCLALKVTSICCNLIFWSAYALLAVKGTFWLCLVFSLCALTLGCIYFYPAFRYTEVSHADHSPA